MYRTGLQQIIRFLKQEFSLSSEQISVALKHSQLKQGPLEIILWQYGFISVEQLDQLQQWLLQNFSTMAID